MTVATEELVVRGVSQDVVYALGPAAAAPVEAGRYDVSEFESIAMAELRFAL